MPIQKIIQNISMYMSTNQVIMPIIIILVATGFCLSVNVLIQKLILKRKNNNVNPILEIYHATKSPLRLMLLILGAYLAAAIVSAYFPHLIDAKKFQVAAYFLQGLGIGTIFWLATNLFKLATLHLLLWAKTHQHQTILLIVPDISESLNAAFLLLLINVMIPNIGLTGVAALIVEKSMKVLFIATIGWIFLKMLSILENFVVAQYTKSDNGFANARKIETQVIIMKRVLFSLVILVTVAAILMVFDSVKSLGTGILTTAGLISAVGAFASQQSLSRLFSGLQFAFTQPLRIGDTVIVDDEFGEVEEINLSYVTVKLWDLRRLIKPTEFFTKNGVVNLTRQSTQLLGTVFIYCDFTMPLEPLRLKFRTLMMNSKSWDQKVNEVDVVDVTEKCMQIRFLVSAENAQELWKLRCEIREKIMMFIVDKYPECLPKARNLALTPKDASVQTKQTSDLTYSKNPT